MKKILFFFAVGVVSLLGCFSCTDDSPAPPAAESPAEQTAPENPYLISQEQAIENLKEAFASFYGSDSRSGEMPQISEVLTYPSRLPLSRSGDEDEILEDVLLYFVNFDKDEGFAVIAGDVRIPQHLLCLTDHGRILPEDLANLVDQDGNVITREIPDYPSPEQLLFTTPRYPGELFINPKVGNFYVSWQQDTLIGNYESDWMPRPNTGEEALVDTIYRTCSFSPGTFVADLCVAYAKNERNLLLADGNALLILPGMEPIYNPPIPGGGNIRPDEIEAEPEFSPWIVRDQLYPMLTAFTSWEQEGIYNTLYPKRHSYVKRKYEKAPAGCFPLSIAKMLAFMRYPTTFVANGFEINWDAVRLNTSHKTVRDNKANLVFGIAEQCQSMYFYNGTFAYPTKVANFFKGLGFIRAHFEPYNSEKAIEQLRRNMPTVAYGQPGQNPFKTHVWNLDGYKIRARNVKITYKYKGEIINVTQQEQIQRMIHCDFGWKGDCNGYFAEDLFNFESAEYDNGDNSSPLDLNNKLNILIF